MSTSDQQGPLTRKQLREIRLTGSTPVISQEEAEAAAEAATPAPPLPRPAEPAEIPPAPVAEGDGNPGSTPLTRRQVRERERMNTASVSVVGTEETRADDAEPALESAEPASQPDAPVELVSAVPDFAAPTVDDTAGDDDDIDDDIDVVPDEEVVVEPLPGDEGASSAPHTDVPEAGTDEARHDVAAVLGATAGQTAPHAAEERIDAGEQTDDAIAADERPTVNPAFGEGLLAEEPDPHAPFRPSFDELLTVGDSAGSQHTAPHALIFTPSPGEGSLSGPVASTGEILVTGSYELPKGLGSRGHADGTTDGKDVDSVLIDGELPPASSPTPIAASSAVSTIKPAGEVIRPPAPEKGNKLMLTLAIVAGGLALALGVALIIAFSTNVI